MTAETIEIMENILVFVGSIVLMANMLTLRQILKLLRSRQGLGDGEYIVKVSPQVKRR